MGRMICHKYIACFGLVFLLALVGCQKEGEWFGPIYPTDSIAVIPSSAAAYLIGCEGNFQNGNASLSAFYPDSNAMINDVYMRANGDGIGDVLQSMIQLDSLIYVVVNNSNLIRIISARDFKEVRTIEGLISPRYIVALDSSRILVTSFGGGALYEIDLQAGTVNNQIDAPLWTESLTIQDELVYVCSKTDSSILIFDAKSLNLNRRISLTGDPIKVEANVQGVFIAVNEAEGVVVYQIIEGGLDEQFRTTAIINAVDFTPRGMLFLTPDELIRVDYEGATYGRVFHGMQTPYSVYGDSNSVLAMDVFDYLRRGEVLHFDGELNVIESYETGIIPQAVLRIQQ